jgi:6-phosphofructokinase 2
MPAVVTITFSPCIDKNIAVHELLPDHKLTGSAPELHPGGGGINIARVLQRFGEQAVAIYPAGGYTGKYLTEMMDSDGISSVVVNSSLATRENIIISETSSGRQYRLGTPPIPLSKTETDTLLGKVDRIASFDFLIVSGSFPPGLESNIMTQLSAIAVKRKAKFIVDTKGKPMKAAIDAGVFLIKPNLGELAALTGKQFIADNDVEKTATQVLAGGKCEAIVVSMGERGAALITADHSERIMAPVVQHKSTVGAGDSMVAGIVAGLLKGLTLSNAVRFGVACGTAATLQSGSNLCEPIDAYGILDKIL